MRVFVQVLRSGTLSDKISALTLQSQGSRPLANVDTSAFAVLASLSVYISRINLQVLRSGTLSDKISALTLRFKESPVHRLAELDKLVELATKHDRRTAQMAQEALKDLFISDLLPDDRRLLPFREQPLLQVNSR